MYELTYQAPKVRKSESLSDHKPLFIPPVLWYDAELNCFTIESRLDQTIAEYGWRIGAGGRPSTRAILYADADHQYVAAVGLR